MTLALQGMRVIDLSQGIPGPLCAMLLGDLGAQVVKVEPIEGDWLRGVGPFDNGESSLYIRLNRNKKGMSVNLKTDKGKAILKSLVTTADVLIEGYRPSAMEELGLGYEEMAKLNPGLIYCSISGQGSKGPMSELPGSELDMQALTGKNRQLGVIGEAPLRVGYDMMSANTAWAAGQGIMAALFHRERTGEGQKVETSIMDASIALMQWATSAEANPDEWRARPLTGYTEPPDHGFQCKDASFLLDMGRDQEAWELFCTAVNVPELGTDPRFNEFTKRASGRPALQEALKSALSNWSYSDLKDLVQGMGGTIVPMNNLASLVKDPQVEALNIIREMQHPVVGDYKTLNIPWDFSEPIAELSGVPSPLLGQHTKELLAELGYKDGDVSSLLGEQVVA